MMIYDPEIAATGCYRYSLIEAVQEDSPPTTSSRLWQHLDKEGGGSPFASDEGIWDDQDSGVDDPQVIDADVAGGASVVEHEPRPSEKREACTSMTTTNRIKTGHFVNHW